MRFRYRVREVGGEWEEWHSCSEDSFAAYAFGAVIEAMELIETSTYLHFDGVGRDGKPRQYEFERE